MSNPPVMVVLGCVTQGGASSPTTIWISPDRDTATDGKVAKIIKYERQLTRQVQMEKGDVLDHVAIGQEVAVRRGDSFVRGQVVEIMGTAVVKVLMVDLGEEVNEAVTNLRNLPTTLKKPKSSLAHRLVLSTKEVEKEDMLLVMALAKECRVGWLEVEGQSQCGQCVIGNLSVKVEPGLEVMIKNQDRLGRSEGEMIVLNRLLGRKNVKEEIKAKIKSKLELVKKSLDKSQNMSSLEKTGQIGSGLETTGQIKSNLDTASQNMSSLDTDGQTKSSIVTDGQIKRSMDTTAQFNGRLTTGWVPREKESSTVRNIREKLRLARMQFEENNLQGNEIVENGVVDGGARPRLESPVGGDTRNSDTALSNNNNSTSLVNGDIPSDDFNNGDTHSADSLGVQNVVTSDKKGSLVTDGDSDTNAVEGDLKTAEEDVAAFDDGSSTTSTSSRQVFMDMGVPDRLELERGKHSRFEERWGVGNTLGKVVVHRPIGGRGVKHCDQVGQMEWVGSLSSYLRQSQMIYSSLVQSIMWPCVSRLQSIVSVAGPGQGKTLGWLLPLLNSLTDRAQYSHLQQGHAPLAIVLCPGLKCATMAADTVQEISSMARLGVRVVMACAGARNNEPSDFINGVDVLITSPPRLKQLMDQAITSLDRCCHLVLEEGDRTLPVWHQQVGEIIVSWRKQRGKKEQGVPDQLVMVSERWNKAVEQFTRTFMMESSSPVVILANMLEAVIYGKVELVPTFHTEFDSKVEQLKILVKERDKAQRIVICCKDLKTVNMVGLMVSELGEKPTVLHSGNDISDVTSSLGRWCDTPTNPLVVSDTVLSNLSMVGADRGTVLIHWDIPTASKTVFSLRFTFIKSGVKNIFAKGPAQPARVHLLMGPEDAPSMNSIITFLKRSGAKIPDTLDLFYSAVSLSKAKQSLATGSPLCFSLSTSGTCSDKMEGRCQARHFLHTELDCPPAEQRYEGVVKFMVLRVETPVVYWVRMQDTAMKYQKLVMGMARHFAKHESREQLKVLEEGRLVAAASSDGVYRRARLERLVYRVRGNMQELDTVEVFTVDCGEKEMVKPEDLSTLPDHLGVESFPPAVIRVIVAGIVATDMDRDWGMQANMYVTSIMEGQVDREVVCRGRVMLHMSNTVWVDRCQVMEMQPTLSKYVCTFETVAWLVGEGLATTNRSHMMQLNTLADRAGIPRPEKVEEKTLDTSMEQEGVDYKIRTAFLPMDEVVTVYMSECLSPSHFYLHRVKHIDSLDRLEKDIVEWAESENLPNYNFKPKEGEVVLAKPDGETFYCRAKVLTVLGAREVDEDMAEPSVEDMFKLFFVDSGIIADVSCSDMSMCKMEFVTKLPFQAVKCSLAQLESVDTEWSREAGDRLFDITRDKGTDEAMCVECVVVEKLEDHYRVKLRNGVNLGADLVEQRLANWLDSKVESDVDSPESENELDNENEVIEDEPESVNKWDTPNGLPENILNMSKLYNVAKEGCEQYLEDNLGPAPVQHPPSKDAIIPTTTTLSQPSSLPTPLPAKLSTTSLPPDMPSLAIVPGISRYQSKVPDIIWSQDHKAIFLNVSISSMRDIAPRQVFISVKEQELIVQVLEVDVSDTNELYILHNTPPLQLYGEVDPDMTKLKVVARGLTITLIKQRNIFWMQLCRQKFGWIKKNPCAANLDPDSSDSECDPVDSLPPAGFISPFLGQADGGADAHGRRYHPLTGEEVLPEIMWQSSDQDSEDEELGFIHDKALEFNPNIL